MQGELFAIEKMNAESETFKDLFDNIFSTFKEKTFVEYKIHDNIESITFAQYAESVLDMARKLSYELNSIPDQSWVILKYKSSPKWFSLFWGLLMCGKNVLLMDYKSEKQLTEILIKTANAKALICGHDDKNDYGIFKIDAEQIESTGKEDVNFQPKWTDSIALCTSGTMSTSKVYIYSAPNFVKLIKNTNMIYQKFNLIFNSGNAKALIMLPLNHVFGLMTSLWMSCMGISLVFPKNNTPKSVFTACREHSVHWLFSVPAFWNRVVEKIELDNVTGKPDGYSLSQQIEESIAEQSKNMESSGEWIRKKYFNNIRNIPNIPSVKICISGGGPIPEKTLKTINGLGYILINGYGSTEVGIISLCADYNIRKRISSSIGIPLPAIKYGVLKKASETYVESVSENGFGELLLKCPWMHNRRLIDGKLMPRGVDSEGWYHTGDIAVIQDGAIILKGREKRVIITESGENIYPEEIELHFAYLPYCRDIDVIGLKDISQNEQVTLVLQILCPLTNKKNISSILTEFSRLNDQLPIYKRVKNLYIKYLPKSTGSIKTRKTQLCEEIESGKSNFQKLSFSTDLVNISENEVAACVTEIFYNCKEKKILSDELKQIISELTGNPIDVIPDNENLTECLNASSLTLMEIFVNIEEKYNVPIPSTDYNKYLTVYNMVEELYKQTSMIC